MMALGGQAGIALDVTRLVGLLLEKRRATGIDRVMQAYVAEFGATARAVVRWRGCHFVLDQPHSAQLFAILRAEMAPSNLWLWLIRAVVASWAARQIPGFWLLNTGHSGLEQPAYVQEMQRLQVKLLVLLHDLIPLTHPEYNRPGEPERHHRRLQSTCAAAAGVIVTTQMTAAQFRDYATAQGWRLPPVLVAPLGVPAALVAPAALLQDEPYFVMLGTIEARKNHLLLLQLWRDWVDSGCGPVPKLVLIGKRGWEAEQTFDLLDRCRQLQGLVVEVQACADADLVRWLAGARALLFPSHTEGFGLPVIEALQQGVPVLAADLPVYREFAGEIPEYLPLSDSKAWAGAVRDYSDAQHPRRLAQIQRLQGYQAPQWAEHFSLVRTWIPSNHEQ